MRQSQWQRQRRAHSQSQESDDCLLYDPPARWACPANAHLRIIDIYNNLTQVTRRVLKALSLVMNGAGYGLTYERQRSVYLVVQLGHWKQMRVCIKAPGSTDISRQEPHPQIWDRPRTTPLGQPESAQRLVNQRIHGTPFTPAPTQRVPVPRRPAPSESGQLTGRINRSTSHIDIEEVIREAYERDNSGEDGPASAPPVRQEEDGDCHLALYHYMWKWHGDGSPPPDLDEGLQRMQSLTLEQVNHALQWCKRVKQTCEYHSNRARTRSTAMDMLNTALSDADFGAIFFGQLADNLEQCQDRTAMAFNEAYTAWRLHGISRGASQSASNDRAKLEVCTSAAKTAVLRRCVALEAKGSESVETYLWVETQLKHSLGLLTFADEAHYSIGKDVVDLDGVRAVVESGWRAELYAMLESQPHLFPTFPVTLSAAAAATFDGKLDAIETRLDAGELSSGQYMHALDELQAERRRALRNARDGWFARCGDSHSDARADPKGRKRKSQFRHRCR